MTEHPQVSNTQSETTVTTAEIIDRLSRFDGPPEQFLVTLLSVQCRLAAASNGAILRATPDGGIEMLAIYPPMEENATAPVWLATAAESANELLSAGTTKILPLHETEALYGQPAAQNLIMMPILGSGSVRGLAAYRVESGDSAALAHSRERLELTINLLSLYEMRLTLQRRQFDLSRLRTSMETLSAVNDHDRFAGAGMSFCNELASRWNCDRVSLGFLKGRYVALKALSHTEKFSRKMKLVQDIESAMEECFDQDLELLYPTPEGATFVTRATEELSKRHGPMNILSMPLRRAGNVVGVVAVERPQDTPFTLEEIETLRLTCDLCTARLANLHESDRWIGARASGAISKAAGHVIGPRHTWAKVIVSLVCVFLAVSLFGKGDYHATATFVIEPQQSRLIPAPFDGYIAEVFVEPGDDVIAGQTVLAKLETIELEEQLIQSRAKLAAAETDKAAKLDEGKIAESQIAQAEIDKSLAEIQLLERRIKEASMISPISGKVISQDIKRRIRAHVQIGEALFDVAPVEHIRAVLRVPEDQIADVRLAYDKAQKEGEELAGEMAPRGRPDLSIEFTVDRINPVAVVEENENVFNVRAKLDPNVSMIPGTEGVAKVLIGERRYAWLWTRKLVNWVRMKLWW